MIEQHAPFILPVCNFFEVFHLYSHSSDEFITVYHKQHWLCPFTDFSLNYLLFILASLQYKAFIKFCDTFVDLKQRNSKN